MKSDPFKIYDSMDAFPEDVPLEIVHLIQSLLSRNPHARPSLVELAETWDLVEVLNRYELSPLPAMLEYDDSPDLHADDQAIAAELLAAATIVGPSSSSSSAPLSDEDTEEDDAILMSLRARTQELRRKLADINSDDAEMLCRDSSSATPPIKDNEPLDVPDPRLQEIQKQKEQVLKMLADLNSASLSLEADATRSLPPPSVDKPFKLQEKPQDLPQPIAAYRQDPLSLCFALVFAALLYVLVGVPSLIEALRSAVGETATLLGVHLRDDWYASCFEDLDLSALFDEVCAEVRRSILSLSFRHSFVSFFSLAFRCPLR